MAGKKKSEEGSMRILLVEDDPDHCFIIKKHLTDIDQRIRVAMAHTGEEALSYLQVNPVEIVVSDYDLPGINGIAMLNMMKAHNIDIPCIFLTGHGNADIERETAKAGAIGYFTKDEGLSGFRKIVDSICNKLSEPSSAPVPIDAKPAEPVPASDLESFLEEARDTVIILADGEVVYSNKAAEELTGYTRVEGSSMSYTDLILPEYKAMVAERYNKRLAGLDVPSRYEVQLRKKDGTVIDVEVSSSVVTYRGRQAILVLIRDVTERKQSEEALLKSRYTIWALMNAVSDPVMLLDPKGHILSSNTGAAARFNLTPEEAQGKCIFELLPEKVASERKKFGDIFLAQRGLMRYEDFNNGIWFDNILQPMLDAEGNVESIALYARDVTDYKQAQEKMKEHNKELKSLLYGISHDMKTPLVNIREYSAELMKGTSRLSNEELEHYIERINVNSHKALNMINGLYNYAHYTSREHVCESVNLGELIREVITDLRDKREYREVSLSIDEKWPDIQADWTLMYQIFMNLLENAIKYGGKNIEVGWRRDGEHYRIWVKDDGIGIEDDIKDRIFDLFTRSPRISSDIQGAGIGLAIVKKAIEHIGGRIELSSQVDNGSTFNVMLPVKMLSGK